MKNYIYCTKDPEHFNLINFYLTCGNETYYLFTQHYSNTAYDRFKNPVHLNVALRYQKGLALESFNKKLPKYIKYIEDSEGITVLKKSIKKSHSYAKCA